MAVTRALIVIDVQNEHVSGALAATFPSLHISMPNIAVVMDTAATRKLFTVIIQRIERRGSPHFAIDRPGSALHPLIAANPRDALFVTSGDGTGEEDLPRLLSDHGVTTATLVGYTLEGAVERVARRLVRAGIDVEILADATGAHGPADDSLDGRAIQERALEDIGALDGVIIGNHLQWEQVAGSENALPAQHIPTDDEDERPSRLRDEFQRIEDAIEAETDHLVSAAEAYQISHTFATGQWFP